MPLTRRSLALSERKEVGVAGAVAILDSDDVAILLAAIDDTVADEC